jgi:hypothetical protein
MQDYQALFSTLAQITATVLGILAAFFAAYFVFLQQQSAQFEDKIEQEKLEIRSSLLRLRGNWPWMLTTFLPMEFQSAYSAKYPDISEDGLVTQLAVDLNFNSPKLSEAISDVQPKDAHGGSWRWRLYFLGLNNTVSVITVGAPDSRTKPQGVFPSSPHGIGFDEWRHTFEKMNNGITLLSIRKREMVADFSNDIAKNVDPAWHKSVHSELFLTAVTTFFDEVQQVQNRLLEIDKQKILQKKYSFYDRLHLWSVATLSVCALLFGVLVPLMLLTTPKVEMTTTVSVVLTLVALLFTFGAVIQLGWDAMKPVLVTREDYVKERWLTPMLRDLEQQKPIFQNGAQIELEYFLNARNSDEKALFQAQISEALGQFIQDGTKYNEATRILVEKVVATIKQDSVLGPPTKDYKSSKGGQILSPPNFLNHGRLETVVQLLDPNTDISVESLHARWAKVEVKIPGAVFASRKSELSQTFNSIRLVMLQSAEGKSFIASKDAVDRSWNALEQKLRTGVDLSP